MTPEDRLAALIAQGTKLPWINEGEQQADEFYGPYVGATTKGAKSWESHFHVFGSVEDANLAITAVNTCPAALAVIRAAREAVAALDADAASFGMRLNAASLLRSALAAWDKDGAA